MIRVSQYLTGYDIMLQEDLRLWLPGNYEATSTSKDEKAEKNDDEKPADKQPLDLEMACRLLRQVGDQFCDLLHQEKNALQEHMAEGNYLNSTLVHLHFNLFKVVCPGIDFQEYNMKLFDTKLSIIFKQFSLFIEKKEMFVKKII